MSSVKQCSEARWALCEGACNACAICTHVTGGNMISLDTEIVEMG